MKRLVLGVVIAAILSGCTTYSRIATDDSGGRWIISCRTMPPTPLDNMDCTARLLTDSK